jgi:hypothetical protein
MEVLFLQKTNKVQDAAEVLHLRFFLSHSNSSVDI